MSMVELTENLVIPMVGSECKHNHVSCTNFKVGMTREQQLSECLQCDVMRLTLSRELQISINLK